MMGPIQPSIGGIQIKNETNSNMNWSQELVTNFISISSYSLQTLRPILDGSPTWEPIEIILYIGDQIHAIDKFRRRMRFQ